MYRPLYRPPRSIRGQRHEFGRADVEGQLHRARRSLAPLTDKAARRAMGRAAATAWGRFMVGINPAPRIDHYWSGHKYHVSASNTCATTSRRGT